MLERVSALASAHPYKSCVLTIAEDRGFTLTQAAGLSAEFEKKLAGLAGELPAKVGKAVESGGCTLMRIGPAQFWIVGSDGDDLAPRLARLCAATPLSHSRTRILLEGVPARAVLAKGIPLDFHDSAFTPGSFALTGLHHMPLVVHCAGPDRFHLYAMRTFALSVWEWLTDAALEFADH
jgi:methylglutamate dehydrogenase subunit D